MMKWPLLLFVGWITIFPDPGIAGPPELPDPPPDSFPTPTLLRQSSALQTHLILGRLQLDPVRYRKGAQSIVHVAINPTATREASPLITETLQVTSTRGLPAIHYSIVGPVMRIMIDADAKGAWRIESHRMSARCNEGDSSSEATRVVVVQTPHRPMTMELHSAASESKLQATTWLHLREAQPDAFKEHLDPILDELLWPYRLSDLAGAAHAQALREALTSMEDAEIIQDERLLAWVEDLRSPVRASRAEAERRLLSVGVSLIPRLEKLDLSRLDAEQRARLFEIQNRLTPLTEDDGTRLSMLIRDDRSYWQLASGRLSLRDRQLVDARFKLLSSELPAMAQDNSDRVAVDERPTRR